MSASYRTVDDGIQIKEVIIRPLSNDERKNELHVLPGCKTKKADNRKLTNLHCSKEVYRLLRTVAQVCIGGAVEKEAGEDGHGDGVKERRPEGDHQGDEHVNGDARHPGLSHSQHRKALHRTGVVGVGKGDHIGKCPCVHRRVRQNAVHPGKAKEREEDVEQSHHQQVPVVGVTLGQPV
ncbi:hypothetical protein TYRP_006592 [Tyrophagus putrescentiae]|nr:hypothetical protein TYRP_006592 [Tyrophagus putrescentiae]